MSLARNLAARFRFGYIGSMSTGPNDRMLRLLATARNHPEFAQRVALALPEQLRLEFARELSQPAVKTTKTKALCGPGLRKCRKVVPAPNNGMSAQLNLFARSVSRVG